VSLAALGHGLAFTLDHGPAVFVRDTSCLFKVSGPHEESWYLLSK